MADERCMIGRKPTDPAAVRCATCGQIKVSCEASIDQTGERCCRSCSHTN